MRFAKKNRRETAINIAPLVDVVFLLVIFFAVTTTFLDTAGLELDLPKSDGRTERDQESLVVFVDREGAIFFDEQPIADTDALAATLREALEARDANDREVVLRGDEKVDYGLVVSVMDAIREAGGASLNLAAQSKPSTASP